tara:strand:- start:6 stop:518 length:513 start_codon:yes stop_codon:yes gene_type:complete
MKYLSFGLLVIFLTSCLFDGSEKASQDIVGWWTEIENSADEVDNESSGIGYSCFGKNSKFGFFRIYTETYEGEKSIEVSWFKGTWSTKGDKLSISFLGNRRHTFEGTPGGDWQKNFQFDDEVDNSRDFQYDISKNVLSVIIEGEGEDEVEKHSKSAPLKEHEFINDICNL